MERIANSAFGLWRICVSAFFVEPFCGVDTNSLFASRYGSGRKKIVITTPAKAKVVAEIKYGPTSLGNAKNSAKLPAGSIKFGPVTAPIVEPHTTNESCLALVSLVARSIATNRA